MLLRRWAAALRDSLIAFDPPVTSCWRAMSRDAISSALATSSGSADASLVEVPNPFAQLFGNEPYHFHFVRIQVPVDRRDPIYRVASGSPVAGGYAFAQRHKPKRSERK
jgi:hypothetical protein